MIREIMMENDNWQDFECDEFDESNKKKKSIKQTKRKWREIDKFKDRQREIKAMDINDHYYSM